MTKKHFIALADMIKKSNSFEIERGEAPVFSEDAILILASFCRTQNANFNSDRWHDYINGYCGKNGGKVKQAV